MAARLNATGDNIDYTADVPTETDFTMMLWHYIVTDRNTFSNLAMFGEDGTSNSSPDASIDLFLGADGTTVNCTARNYNGTAVTTVNCATANWYHSAVYGHCGTSQPFSVSTYRLSTNATTTASGTTDTLGTWPTTTAGHVQVGQIGDGVWLNGRVTGFKLWSGVQLTLAQIEWERWFYMPVFSQANFWCGWPLLDASDNRDISGNGRGPTLTSLGTEDGPPLMWAAGKVAQATYFRSASATTITATGLAQANAFGTARLDGQLLPTGFANGSVFGTARFDGQIVASGIATGTVFGNVQLDYSILAAALSSGAAYGGATLQGDGTINPDTLPTGAVYGTLTLNGDETVTPSGIVTSNAFGLTQLNVIISPTPIASGTLIGAIIVAGEGSGGVLGGQQGRRRFFVYLAR